MRMVHGKINNRGLQRMNQPAKFVYGMTQIQANVGRYLVVAGASGVQRLPASPTRVVRRFSIFRWDVLQVERSIRNLHR